MLLSNLGLITVTQFNQVSARASSTIMGTLTFKALNDLALKYIIDFLTWYVP